MSHDPQLSLGADRKGEDPDRIESIRNLGPATARMLAEIGIETSAELRRVGSVAAYRRLKFRFGRAVTAIALYAMEAGLRGLDWRALDAESRRALLAAAQGNGEP